jgi:hypothetical protein
LTVPLQKSQFKNINSFLSKRIYLISLFSSYNTQPIILEGRKYRGKLYVKSIEKFTKDPVPETASYPKPEIATDLKPTEKYPDSDPDSTKINTAPYCFCEFQSQKTMRRREI